MQTSVVPTASGNGVGRQYRPPRNAVAVDVRQIMRESNRSMMHERQLNLLRAPSQREVLLYCAGDLSILSAPTVSIVGTRELSAEGARRAARLARELAGEDYAVMSGLARGVDTVALTAALAAGGRVAAVIGTPLDKAYPAENAMLQEEIYTDHLLVSPFAEGGRVFKSNFPKRNRVMALLSDATVIIEASDTSGTLHQAAECLRQDRWLFLLKSVADNPRLRWPKDFIGKPKVRVIEKTGDLVDAMLE